MSTSKHPNPSPSPSLPLTPLSPSEFSHAIAKIAVTQILRSIGFKSSKSSALQTLTRVATLFLQSLSKFTASHAAFSFGRSYCNVYDVVHALEDLSLPFGFSGASDLNQTLLSSKTLTDLQYFLDAIDDIPSSRGVARRIRNYGSSVVFSGNFDFSRDSRGPEIPRWLPAFPELRTDERVNAKDKESLWEEKSFEYRPPPAAKIKKGEKEFMLQGRRERVKFRLGRRRRNAKAGSLDGLELRNGVCRGGKRVCLINRVNISKFFQEDDDDEKVLTNGF